MPRLEYRGPAGGPVSGVLFDFDGTIADTTLGIVRSMQYALERLHRPPIREGELAGLISASIHPTFVKMLGTGDEALIQRGIGFFRERYSSVGLFENRVYDGIPELLEALDARGVPMFIVTSKPKAYADRIVEKLPLGRFVRDVYGPSLEEMSYTKSELIGSAIRSGELRPSGTAMIGDRREDIAAGKANGTVTIAVTYGSGSLQELAAAGPDHICHSPHQVRDLLA